MTPPAWSILPCWIASTMANTPETPLRATGICRIWRQRLAGRRSPMGIFKATISSSIGRPRDQRLQLDIKDLRCGQQRRILFDHNHGRRTHVADGAARLFRPVRKQDFDWYKQSCPDV